MAILRIELLEDCDLNSGRVLNTHFVEDVFYDDFGLPYIPAWIVRNSLVRAVKNSEGELPGQCIDNLLRGRDRFVLDDALVADRESMRQAIIKDTYNNLLRRNPQIVLHSSGFTHVKAISVSNGDGYIRMLSKGTIFESYFEFPEQSVSILKDIIERTKVLYVGHDVRARFSVDVNWERPKYDTIEPEIDFNGAMCRMEYNLHTISRTVNYDHVSKKLYHNSYIEGADVRDALKNRSELEDIFADSRVRCSYAYIEVCGRRGFRVPASFVTKKQDKTDLRDICSRGRRKDDYVQIKVMGTTYIDDPDGLEVNAVDVRKEHGVVRLDKDEALYNQHYTALAEGQTFKGFIEGPTDDIRRIYKSLSDNGYVRTGDFHDYGFGNNFIEVCTVRSMKKHEPLHTREITVLLVSPARLYRNGQYEVSAANVLTEIQRKLGNSVELEIIKNCQNTSMITRYNMAWKEMEPIEYGMSSGSIYRIKARDDRMFDISPLMGGVFIGGHNDIGYGEVLVIPSKDIYYRTINYGVFKERGFSLSYKVDPNPGRRLMKKLYQANANAVAAYIGATQASKCIDDAYNLDAVKKIQSVLKEDFDMEEFFQTYIDSMKKVGINVIRRACHE